MLKPRSSLSLVGTLMLSQLLASCSKGVEESPAYQAACQGSPLRTIERRNEAMEEGYDINRQYDCVDKASFAAIQEQKIQWEVANTPEAIAQRKAERENMIAREQAIRANSIDSQKNSPPLPQFVLRNVDVNTATESELANVPGISPIVAAQILQERQKRRFENWDDLVSRVAGLSAALPAARASACGLNVDGQSLAGVPPDPVVAATIYARFRENIRP
jgi:DNA uptake protein ComE-like DNA-binding protein